MNKDDQEVLLTCGCKRCYTPLPAVGDMVWCIRHPRTNPLVVALLGRPYHVRCLGCRFSRKYASRETATRYALSHVRAYDTHSVELTYSGDLLQTITLDLPQLPY